MSLRSFEASNPGELPVGNPKRRRRPRAAVACDSCRTRKVKCDGQFPCSSCVQHSFECSFKERPPLTYVDYRRQSTSPDTSRRASDPASVMESQAVPRPPRTEGERRPPLTSPVSLSDAAFPASPITTATHGSDSRPSVEREPEGLGDINQHTEGSEFYGHTGTFYFLSRLQSRAKGQRSPKTALESGDRGHGKATADDSVVNLLHSSDYSVSGAHGSKGIGQPSTSPQYAPNGPPYACHSVEQSAQAPPERRSSIGTEIERECVRLYFVNLHCIHPILEQALFLSRCEKEVWMGEAIPSDAPTPRVRARTRFLALFNIVLAIGAITAGETSLAMWNGAAAYLDEACRQDGKFISSDIYLPIKASQLFFERSKLHLEDTFESSSFETAQTLFLMKAVSGEKCVHLLVGSLFCESPDITGFPFRECRWYNCTYVLDSTMVLLYVVLSNMSPITSESIMEDIEKSLEIFSSMKRLAVARRCTEITKEMLAIARSHRDKGQQPAQNSNMHNDAALLSYLANAPPLDPGDGPGGELDLYEGDPFASLVDTNLVFNFLNFEDWAAWSDAGNA
ncbi:hypothetical protein AK830_g4956 [Neonectria ditissima]|uniref:Zn(2)-C6 fungal-type domain-containing protein n=1 Tax=Neonectria ditissima TaxID=78410 RepID=A0A0N8H7E9_9HYPO|nr:hypothetical protein AK830_g4956 [Neonectria ditissima]